MRPRSQGSRARGDFRCIPVCLPGSRITVIASGLFSCDTYAVAAMEVAIRVGKHLRPRRITSRASLLVCNYRDSDSERANGIEMDQESVSALYGVELRSRSEVLRQSHHGRADNTAKLQMGGRRSTIIGPAFVGA